MTKKHLPLKSRYGPAATNCRARAVCVFVMAFLFLLVMSVPRAHAHHGRDFILIQDSAIPSQFSGVAMAGYQWTRDGDNNYFSTEPGFYIGLTSALAFGITADFSNDGNDWNYTGITPQFVFSLLGPWGPRNLRIGFWAGYDFAEDTAEPVIQTLSSSSGGGTGTGPDARRSSSLSGPVALHAGGHGTTTSSQSGGGGRGINRHGESGLYSRFIVETDVTKQARAVFNLINFIPDSGGKAGFGYAAGVRYEVNHDLSFGIEALGEFLSHDSSHEVLLTSMIGLPKHFSLRLGIGGGLTQASSDFTMSTSFLWRF